MDNNGAEKFPFLNYRHADDVETETICFEIANVPTCRLETYFFQKDYSDFANLIRKMRLDCNMTAVELSKKAKVDATTISKYENGNFNIENLRADILTRMAIACNKPEDYLLTPFLKFKKYHKAILRSYLEENGISIKELAIQCGVSYTLAKTWLNKEKRSPSYELWQTTFKDFSLYWIDNNIN